MSAPAVGTIEYDDSTYNGEYITDEEGMQLAHGKGRCVYHSGDVYEGEYSMDVFHGTGTYSWGDGGSYSGGWVEGMQEGYGVLTIPPSEVYEGEWKGDQRHGIGKTTTDGVLTYEGEYKDNAATGKGKLYGADYTYEGDVLNGAPHGKGKHTGKDGTVYEGAFVQWQRQGEGFTTLPSGDTYRGGYYNNLYHGKGVYTWADGRRYEGEFAHGIRHGRGREYLPNGDSYVGTWIDGKPSEDLVFEPKELLDAVLGDANADLRRAIAAMGEDEHILPPIVRGPSVASTNASPVRGATSTVDAASAIAAAVGAAGGGYYSSDEIAHVLSKVPDAIKSSIHVTASIRPAIEQAMGGIADPNHLASLLAVADGLSGGAANTRGGSVASVTEAQSTSRLGSTSNGGASAMASPLPHHEASAAASSSSSTAIAPRSRGIPLDVLERYTPMNLLGKGSFGAAYEAVLPTGRIVCVKVVELSALKDPAALASLHNEIALMQRLQHPNVVDFYGCTRDDQKQTLNIFMEYVTGGSLITYTKKFKVVPEPTVKRWTYQIVCGVHYLHTNNVIHRDIKGENILMTNDGVVKLADFGCSKLLGGVDSRTQGCCSMVGTPYWMAPEVIMCSKDSNSSYGTKADIWSVGCTIVEMITGRPPWPEAGSVWRAIYQIANSTGPPLLPDSIQGLLRDFLLTIFERDPLLRPSADDLLRHPYLAGYKGY